MELLEAAFWIISAISLVLIISFFVTRMAEQSSFRKNLQVGHPLYFYINEEKFRGTLVEYGDYTCIVKDVFGDVVPIPTNDLYPMIGFNYKKDLNDLH